MREMKRTTSLCSVAAAIIGILMFTSAVAQGAPDAAVAFVQPDAALKRIPYEAFHLVRAGAQVDSRQPILACDVVVFERTQSTVPRILITTVFSGRNILLDKSAPEATVGCDDKKWRKPTLSASARRLWQDVIARGDRFAEPQTQTAATKGSPASTRDGQQANTPNEIEFDMPVFKASRALLIEGRRTITVPWIGRAKKYRVELARAETGEVLAEAVDVPGNQAELKDLDLKPGQYALKVVDDKGYGQRMDQLFVVSKQNEPPAPSALASASINSQEKALLYVYFLEGLDDGRWMFEALQRAASISPRSPMVDDWMSMFKGVNAR